VSLGLTYPHRLCLFRVLLGTTATVTSFPLSKHTGEGGATPTFSSRHVYLQFTWEVSLPPSPVGLSSHSHFYKPSRSKVAGPVLPLLPSPAGLFIYRSIRDCPSPPLWHSGCPTLFAVFFVVDYSVWVFFSFFPGWVSVCPGGYADLAQGCLWEYHVPLSSHGGLSSW
jgi:hypothetical protein